MIGLVWRISDWIRFERNKEGETRRYISLYREHSMMMIVLFLALLIGFGEQIVEQWTQG